MRPFTLFLPILPAFLLATGVLSAAPPPAEVVTHWNELAVNAGRKLPFGPALGPNSASRAVAIAQLAVYEAVVSVSRDHAPYRSYIPHATPISLEAAVASAAHGALIAIQPDQATQGVGLDHELTVSLGQIEDGPAKQNGIELGWLAASSIVASRINDGAATAASYPGSTTPGAWRPTPRNPEFLDPPTNANPSPPLAASDPQWGALTPFALLTQNQFRAPAPPLLTSAEYATALNEIKLLGSATAPVTDPPTDPPTGRSTEQTNIARFWAQPTHLPFNAIARTLSDREELSIEDAARLFALLNLALSDSRVAAWDSKYVHGFWRPITAIRLADTDGNDDTAPDPTWQSLLETPNHPDYVSGHSATGAAGAAVLAAYFGDARSFSVASTTLTGVTRSFTRFSDAAAENALSRLYGGIHFRFSNELGLELGDQVGKYVAANELQSTLQEPEPGEGGQGGEGQAGDGQGGDGQGGEPAVTGGTAGKGGAAGKGGTAGNAGSSGNAGRGGSAAGGGNAGRGGSTATGGSAGRGGSGGSAGRGGAGAGATGGTTATPPNDDDGCSCSVPGGRNAGNPAWLSLAGLAFVLARRGRTTRR
jgi:MYXO-CTERM domain-containing protein